MRLFKTRALAADAIRAGSVEINAQPVKPAREVHAGETVTVQQGVVLRTLRVVGDAGFAGRREARGRDICTDLTPPEEFEKARLQRMQHVLAREQGSGRPTKRERREIDRLFL